MYGTLNNGGLRWVFDLNDDRRFTAGVDRAFTFGTAATDLPVVGNWNGNRAGQDQAGLYRAQSGVDLWVLDANNDGAWSGPTIDRRINFGVLGGTTAQPVVGDWQADGIDDVGVYFNGNWEVDFDGDGVYSASDWSPRNPVGVGPFTYNAGGQITGGPGNARAITGNLSETPVSSSSDPLGQPRGDELVLVDPATGIYYFTTFAEPGYLAYTDARYTTASSITFTAQWNLQTFFAGADNRYDFRSARLLVRTNQMTTAQVIANVTQTNRPFVGSGIDRILYDGLRGTDSRNIAGSTFADLFVQFVAFDNQLGRIVVFSQPRTRVFNSF